MMLFRRLVFVICVVALSLATSCELAGPRLRARGTDPAVRKLLEEITRRQPEPYALPENNTYNYIWAQYMMSFLAAERCGYLPRQEAVSRLKGMLDTIEVLENYHGFYYDRYDLSTGKKDTDQIYFQGWWIFGLIILKNAYEELAPQCERMLAAIDYEKARMFDPEKLEMTADHWPEEGRHNLINFFWGPSSEMRSPYVAYTYLTGDIRPWTKKEVPGFMEIEGRPALRAWHNFAFCSMLMHSVFPDLGYFEHHWDELIKGLDEYRERNDMIFYPTRAEPLEAWAKDMPVDHWMNTEHRIAKPWLAWFGDANAPVMEKAFIPGSGISLYYDNMNVYWSYGNETIPCEDPVGAGNRYEFTILTWLPHPQPDLPDPAKLTSVKLLASKNPGTPPESPLEILLNGEVIASIQPDDLGAEPRLVDLPTDLLLSGSSNRLEVISSDPNPEAYRLYRHENTMMDVWYVYSSWGREKKKDVTPPYLEITINGQHAGGETPYALLARCAVVHGYYVWHELLDDPQFLENTVVWVGDYYDRARIGRVVHNVSETPVTVHYERPAEWLRDHDIKVTDITDGGNAGVPVQVSWKELRWQAEPWHTYRVGYAD
jgi:hypothetical protein